MTNRFDVLWERLKKEIPNAKLIPREKSWVLRVLFWVINNVLRSKKNYSNFATTLFNRIYVGVNWERKSQDEKYVILRHEMQHLRQFRNFPFKCFNRHYLWLTNALIMSFCYLCLLPVKYTMRARFEREGYKATLIAMHEVGSLNVFTAAGTKNWILKLFISDTYLYMATQKATEKWLNTLLDDIFEGKYKDDKDKVG